MGHTGTLDPFATGLLVILTGRATRLARFVEQQFKTYVAVARLGAATDTDDATGTMIQSSAPASWPDAVRVERELRGFLGRYSMRPPAYSAKKIEGARSYARARRGESVALAEVVVEVREIELLEYQPPDVTFRATVSPGTYLRAIGRDLGERLGLGAHLTGLRRTAIGDLRVDEAVPLQDLDANVPLVPLSRVLGHLAEIALTEAEATEIGHGRTVRATQGSTRSPVVLTREGRVVAIADAVEDAAGPGLHPCVVLETA